MRQAMSVLMKKDFRGITSNRRMFSQLLIVPFILVTVLPSVFVLTAHFAPDDPDNLKLLELLPAEIPADSIELAIAGLIFNYILPMFFLMIPTMTASIMAATSFVGEKEKHTLETLLYSPLTLKEIFQAKVLASFLFSMMVSLISFVFMLLVLELEVFFLMGSLVVPSLNWLVILLLLSPGISLIAVTLIVRGSAKAQSVEESQQGAVFLIVPVILLVAGQFSGVLLLNGRVLLVLSAVCWLFAWMLLQKTARKFTYEILLK